MKQIVQKLFFTVVSTLFTFLFCSTTHADHTLTPLGFNEDGNFEVLLALNPTTPTSEENPEPSIIEKVIIELSRGCLHKTLSTLEMA